MSEIEFDSIDSDGSKIKEIEIWGTKFKLKVSEKKDDLVPVLLEIDNLRNRIKELEEKVAHNLKDEATSKDADLPKFQDMHGIKYELVDDQDGYLKYMKASDLKKEETKGEDDAKRD